MYRRPMGSYLEKPVTSKHSYASEENGMRFGASAMQGWRVEMEDAHTIIEKIGECIVIIWTLAGSWPDAAKGAHEACCYGAT
jgi:protein phosphatase 1B